jgi:hypothetical protein
MAILNQSCHNPEYIAQALEEYESICITGAISWMFPQLTGEWEEDQMQWMKDIYPDLLLERFANQYEDLTKDRTYE